MEDKIMAYIKLNNDNVIIQKQPNFESGFIEAPDDVICGMIKQSDGSFKKPEITFDMRMMDIRVTRNALLQESDWTQSRDVTLTKDTDWKTYRQSLRDITNGLDTVDKINNVTWPTKPS
tara:strand:- start:216 stop:572 length:357 start_codon:yes stop_codon:yes gene_type:complete